MIVRAAHSSTDVLDKERRVELFVEQALAMRLADADDEQDPADRKADADANVRSVHAHSLARVVARALERTECVVRALLEIHECVVRASLISDRAAPLGVAALAHD